MKIAKAFDNDIINSIFDIIHKKIMELYTEGFSMKILHGGSRYASISA